MTLRMPDAVQVPEFTPVRLDVADTVAIKNSLDEHGYACIKDVASEAELEEARDLLWEHLEGRDTPLMRQARPVGWKRGQPTTWIEGHGDGLMSSGTHCSAMWCALCPLRVVRRSEGLRCEAASLRLTCHSAYGSGRYVRALPGVVKAFEAAYGEPAVAAYDRLSVNLPTSSGNPAALRQAGVTYKHGKLRANGLHTHFNQDSYGEHEQICYAIFNFWDMDKAGGATAIVPGSHKAEKVQAINRLRAAQYTGQGRDRKWTGQGKEEEFLSAFTDNGVSQHFSVSTPPCKNYMYTVFT
jgi:hypothetical protein